jgi:hypothetical protein
MLVATAFLAFSISAVLPPNTICWAVILALIIATFPLDLNMVKSP